MCGRLERPSARAAERRRTEQARKHSIAAECLDTLCCSSTHSSKLRPAARLRGESNRVRAGISFRPAALEQLKSWRLMKLKQQTREHVDSTSRAQITSV